MNKLIAIIFFGMCLMTVKAENIFTDVTSNINTNTHFKAQEFDISIAPTVSAPSFMNSSHYTIGASLETEYWQTEHTGTGLELGTYDVRSTAGIVDHIAIMEDIRLVPFPNVKFLNQFDLELKSGAETYFVDDTKDLELGLGIDFDFTVFKHHFRSDVSAMQHIRSNPARDGVTIKWDIKLFSF